MKWTLQMRAFRMVSSLQSVRLMACSHKHLRSASKGVFVDGILWKWMSLDWPCLFLHPTAQQDIFITGISPVSPTSLSLFPLFFRRHHNARATTGTQMWYQTKKKFCVHAYRKKGNSSWKWFHDTKLKKSLPLQKSSSAASYSTSPFYSESAHHYYVYLILLFAVRYTHHCWFITAIYSSR